MDGRKDSKKKLLGDNACERFKQALGKEDIAVWGIV